MEVFSRALRRWGARCPGGAKLYGGQAGGGKELTGVVRDGARQAKPEELAEGNGFKDGVGTTVKVTNSVEPFDGQGQAGQQPDHQQAVAFMVADMFEAVAVLGIVKAFVLDLPAALGHAEDGPTADPVAREVGEPVGLVRGCRWVCTGGSEPRARFPNAGFPKGQSRRHPRFPPGPYRGGTLDGELGGETFSGRPRTIRGDSSSSGRRRSSPRFPASCREGGAGEVPVDDHIIGKTAAQVAGGTAEKSPTGTVLAIPRAVGFDIQGQGQAGSHHTDHDQLMVVAEDLSFSDCGGDGTDRKPFPCDLPAPVPSSANPMKRQSSKALWRLA